MSDEIDSATVVLEVHDETDRVEIPTGLLDRLADPADTHADVVGDIVVMAFTGRAHHLAHHGEDAADEELEAIEARLLDLFEQRFDVTYAEATGHAH